jgi:hypothetical protein
MFNENHQQYMISHFHYLDKLFSDAIADLAPPSDGRLFDTHLADARPEQRKILWNHVAQLRLVMQRFMQAQKLRVSTPPIRALWAFHVANSYARTAVSELRPAYLRHYGAVDAGTAEAAERLVADLLVPLQHIAAYLDPS